MKGKKSLLVISFFAIVGLLLASCAPAVAPTPTPGAAAPPAAPTKAPPVAAATPVPVAPTPRAAAPTLTPAVEKPKYGGTFPISIYMDPPSLDPHQESSFSTVTAMAPVTNQVIRFDPVLTDYSIVPDLAKSWEISKDSTVYTFQLNQGVKSHDGKEFTSEDVKFNLERITWPPKGLVSVQKALFAPLKKVEAPDRNTVVLTLEYPFAPFLECLAKGHMLMLPKHVVEPLGPEKLRRVEHAIGTGPFKLKSYTRGVSWEHVKNPAYWKEGLPYLDAVRHYIMPDPAARFAALRVGRVLSDQKSPGIEAPQVKWVDQHASDFLAYRPNFPRSLRTVMVNVERAPFSDFRIRKAIHLAIDRDRVLALAYGGLGIVGSLLTSAGYWGMPQEELRKLPGYRHPKDADVAEAKRLLSEAGYSEGFDCELLVRRAAGYEPFAEAIQRELAQIGIRATIRLLEVSVLMDRGAAGNFAIMADVLSPALVDPQSVFGEGHIAGGARNWARSSHPKVEELFAQQSRILDKAKRREINLEIEKILMEEVLSCMPVLYVQKAIPYWKKVKNWPGLAFSYDQQSMEVVWLAE